MRCFGCGNSPNVILTGTKLENEIENLVKDSQFHDVHKNDILEQILQKQNHSKLRSAIFDQFNKKEISQTGLT